MAYSEDHIALAAEYALGTLDAGERAQVATMMAADPEFAAVVHAWEYRLGVLNQMVGTIEPRPIVWENIRLEIARTAPSQDQPQEPSVLSDAPPPLPESSAPEPPPLEPPSLDAHRPEPLQSDSDAIPDFAPLFVPQTHAPDPRVEPATQVPVADNSNVIQL